MLLVIQLFIDFVVFAIRSRYKLLENKAELTPLRDLIKRSRLASQKNRTGIWPTVSIRHYNLYDAYR